MGKWWKCGNMKERRKIVSRTFACKPKSNMASVYVSFGPQAVLTIVLWHGLSSYDIGTMSMSAPVRPWSHRPLSPLPMPPSPKCPLSPSPPPPARFPPGLRFDGMRSRAWVRGRGFLKILHGPTRLPTLPLYNGQCVQPPDSHSLAYW